MDKVPDARVRQLCGLTKGVDEKIDEIVLRWFGRVERMENNRIAKRVYVDECAGSRSVGRPQKRWINTLKDCLKKRGLDVRQAGKIVHDRSVWRGFLRWNAWDIAGGMNPGVSRHTIVVRFHSLMKLWKGGNPSVVKPTT